MGRRNADPIGARAPELTRRPKTLGGPMEAGRNGAPDGDEIALLNAREVHCGLLRTPIGDCAYFAAPSPTAQGASEDCVLIRTHDSACFVVIADGAGGHPAGDQASRIAAREVADHLAQLDVRRTSARTAILDGFEAASERIMRETRGALTTLLVGEMTVRNGALSLRTYHAGDTGALVFSARGRVRWNTVPHSPIGYAVESGLMGPDEALHHEDLNLVSSLVGGPDVRVEMSSWIELKSGETAVMASDGLLDNAYRHEIGKAASVLRLEEASRRLADLVRTRMVNPEGHLSKPDDCSFVLFRAPSSSRASKRSP